MQHLLDELAQLLKGLNYQLSLNATQCTAKAGYYAEDYIREVWGPKYSLESSSSFEPHGVLYEIKECLHYAGDPGHGPDATALKSERFSVLIEQLFSQLQGLLSRADYIARILFEVHPYYPVFWDFAFVIASPQDGAWVLVGSASD